MNLPTISLSKQQESLEVSKGLSLAPSAVGILISLVVLTFVVWPKFHEVLRLRSSNAELTTRAQNLETKAQKLASLDKDTLEKQLAAAEQLLPSDKEVFSLLRQVEITASASGILLNKVDAVAGTINKAGAPPPTTLTTDSATSSLAPNIQLELSTTSSYASFLQFLASLYSSSRVVSVENLTLSAVSSEGGLQVRSALTVDAFWKSLPSDLGLIETPIEDLTTEEVARLKAIETAATSQPQVPSVPLGRNDLFAPF
ncbi:hypothetical protein A3B51_00255 [Candidatus Curtissbacteria bacterium RIFCSPLOWO2_01_FULL_41_18]|uniref:Pilus assembly protein PilO n=2 Tax=Candidatus Curtissiibacteriota TaxID=1752717 RepID=A0A1F5FZE6_9BACT|nr:MAG: hypothetical protein A2696_02895 [Candidatus Curtissbacteria bacterium RIFCSPHIGHO2_01_FULL_41_13]OGE04613.1 MAG: hypothetical protein A3B51_00255 [Candidatus Curtissbacteria bacterium RIFCSPLOWO2_01_FULL_41_18]